MNWLDIICIAPHNLVLHSFVTKGLQGVVLECYILQICLIPLLYQSYALLLHGHWAVCSIFLFLQIVLQDNSFKVLHWFTNFWKMVWVFEKNAKFETLPLGGVGDCGGREGPRWPLGIFQMLNILDDFESFICLRILPKKQPKNVHER